MDEGGKVFLALGSALYDGRLPPLWCSGFDGSIDPGARSSLPVCKQHSPGVRVLGIRYSAVHRYLAVLTTGKLARVVWCGQMPSLLYYLLLILIFYFPALPPAVALLRYVFPTRFGRFFCICIFCIICCAAVASSVIIIFTFLRDSLNHGVVSDGRFFRCCCCWVCSFESLP